MILAAANCCHNPLMFAQLDWWRFLAGLAFFLLGMRELETGLRVLADRPVKLFLQRYTRNPIEGIAVGTVTTAVLQSSSLVSLIVLAFVGAGILTLQNALGVIIGANLGTTFTGWVVATIGFKLDLEGAALPVAGLGGLAVIFFGRYPRLGNVGRIVLGLGFLLLGLSFMKESMAELAENANLEPLQGYGLFVYLVFGLFLTALIQSSSATMMITLGALASGLIALEPAAALIVGADLGTTSTVLLGGLKGTAAKRRVAVAHFFFNLITDSIAFLLLPVLLLLITGYLGFSDPLYVLVMFHTTFNLLGILIFIPFLGWFARQLHARVGSDEAPTAAHISQVPVSVTETALQAIKLEVTRLLFMVQRLNTRSMGIDVRFPEVLDREHRHVQRHEFGEQYETIKQLEGELLDYITRMQEQSLGAEESQQLSQYLLSVRHAVQSAKAIKDIRHNLLEYQDSVNPKIVRHEAVIRERMQGLYGRMAALWTLKRGAGRFSELAAVAEDNLRFYESSTQQIYAYAHEDELEERELSTMLNVNRELYSATKYLVLALKDALLNRDQAEQLEGLPGAA